MLKIKENSKNIAKAQIKAALAKLQLLENGSIDYVEFSRATRKIGNKQK
jgi:hypothetical protein